MGEGLGGYGVIIDRMVSSINLDVEQTQLHKIEIKLASIEERIRMQFENAIVDYVSDQMILEDSKKKPKPYYRKGRWE